MCRAVLYLGQPISLEDILYNPDNSLIKQTHSPKLMSGIQNLAGFGMALWEKKTTHKRKPFLYKTTQLPFFDANLHELAKQFTIHCLLAHVRGVAFSYREVITPQNSHPFLYENSTIVLAHNGTLTQFDDMKHTFYNLMRPEIASQLKGTTDSEWIYALFLSQLTTTTSPKLLEMENALFKTLELIAWMRKKHKIGTYSAINLFVSNGIDVVATRFVLGYGQYSQEEVLPPSIGYQPLWYTFGEKYLAIDDSYQMTVKKHNTSIIIASEPLTANINTWIEVPAYSLIAASRANGDLTMEVKDIPI